MAREPIQVEAIVFRWVNKKIEYLMLKRIPEKGGFWQPVTGGMETGETMKDALLRELKEETKVPRSSLTTTPAWGARRRNRRLYTRAST